MKILAIESSSITASVAFVVDDMLTAEYTINHKKTHSQTLLSMIDEICRMAEVEISSIELIAISNGPGSFTGLRIGSATGKGLGLAHNIPVVSVPTLEAMAYNYFGYDKLICPIMDARRGFVYTGVYEWPDGNHFQKKIEQTIISIDELIKQLNCFNQDIIFLGDAVEKYKSIIEANMINKFTFAPVHMNTQRAGSVALLGRVLYEKGESMNARDHLPEYLRPSQAERELTNK